MKADHGNHSDSGQEASAKDRLRQFIFSKAVIIGVGVLLVYTVVGFWLVPFWAKRMAISYVKDKLDRQLTIGALHTNPYLFTLKAKDLQLREKDGTAILGFHRLLVDFELESLFRRAWTFREVDLTQPAVRLIAASDGSLNLARLAAAAASPKKLSARGKANDDPQSYGSVPRLIVKRLRIDNGSLSFVDRSATVPAEAKLNGLDLKATHLTTTSDESGTASMTVVLPEEGRLSWQGRISLTPLTSTGQFSLQALKADVVWRFLRDRLDLQKPAGTVDLGGTYRFSLSKGSPALSVDALHAKISDVALRLRESKTPILELARVDVSNGKFDLSPTALELGSVSVVKGNLRATVADDGRLDWHRIILSRPGAGKQVADPASPASLRFRLDELVVDQLGVAYEDYSKAEPIRLDIARVKLQLGANMEQREAGLQAVFDKIGIELTDVGLRTISTNEQLVQLPRVTMGGGRVDLVGRGIHVEEVDVDGGRAFVRREQSGVINYVRIFGEEGAIKRAVSKIQARAKAENFPWTVDMAKFQLKDFSLDFTDRTVSTADIYSLKDLGLSVTNFVTRPGHPFDFNLDFAVAQGGKSSAHGQADIYGPWVEATVKADQIALAPLQPYLASIVRLNLVSGRFSAHGKLDYRSEGGNEPLFSGESRIEGLLLALGGTTTPFFSFKKLEASGISIHNDKQGALIDQAVLVAPDGKLVIRQDKSLNLEDLIVHKEKSSPQSAGATSPSSPKPSTPKMFPVTVRSLRVEQGKLDFADLSLTPHFKAKIEELAGRVDDLSSVPERHASLELEGRVDPYGSLSVKGELIPASVTQYSDVAMHFRNVDMTSLSPFAAKFAGREIAAGRLFLNLNYKIRGAKLDGTNQLTLVQFRLGHRVESKSALDIPLDLAVALLRDSSGNIHIRLPVSGNVESPDFSFGDVIGSALSSLLIKIVTSPFRVLGELVGMAPHELNAVGFQPGAAKLPPPQQEKLNKLAEALRQRPQLALEVKGTYDLKADGKVLRERVLCRDLAARTGVPPDSCAEPGLISFAGPDIQRLLETMGAEQLPDAERQKLRQQYHMTSTENGGKSAQASESRNAAAEPGGYYQALFEQLAQRRDITKTQFETLARDRAEGIVEYLTSRGKIDRDRLNIVAPAETDKIRYGLVPSKLSLRSAT